MDSNLFKDINFISQLESALQDELPGLKAQLGMASNNRLHKLIDGSIPSDAVESSVLILLYPKGDKLSTVFIKRQDYEGVHSGQISFPGGRRESTDADFTETALREAFEEVNINPRKVRTLGSLTPLYIPPSNFVVYPIVGFSGSVPDFMPQESEVADIIETNLKKLFKSEARKRKKLHVRGATIDTPYFDINGHVIWGATAMILNELKVIIESLDSSQI